MSQDVGAVDLTAKDTAAVTLSATDVYCGAQTPLPPYDVLLVISDDLGREQHSWDDAALGGKNLWAPGYNYATLDHCWTAGHALLAGGVACLDFRSQPICAPTRAELFTGLLPSQSGIGTNDTTWSQAQTGTLLTLPAMIEAGASTYKTALFGKWGLDSADGSDYDVVCANGRWDHFAGNLDLLTTDGGAGYYDWNLVSQDKGSSAVVTPQTAYAGKVLADQCLTWIQARQAASEHFLAVWAPPMAHVPILGDDWPSAAMHYQDGLNQGVVINSVRAHHEALDYQLGRILSAVTTTNLVVVYVTDNGSAKNVLTANQHPAEVANDPPAGVYDPDHGKVFFGATWEGCVRGSCTITGPIVAAALQGTQYAPMVQPQDIFATIADIVCADWRDQLPESEARSLVPVLTGQMTSHGRRYTYIDVCGPMGIKDETERTYTTRAVTDGTYKLIRSTGLVEYLGGGLYNLSTDPDEQSPIAEPYTGADLAAYTDLDAEFERVWG